MGVLVIVVIVFCCCNPKQKNSQLLVLSLNLEFDNNLGVGLGCRGDVLRLPGRCARVVGEMCEGAKVKSILVLGLEFDNKAIIKFHLNDKFIVN